MVENLPILYQNIIFGLPSKLAEDAFLWATERPGEDRMCYRAEKFAREVHHLFGTLTSMLDAASGNLGAQHESHDPDLMNFILKRHANYRFDGNQSPTYC